MKCRDADGDCGAGVLVVGGLHAGTMCHSASITVMTALIIFIEGNCCVFFVQLFYDLHRYL